MPKVQKCSTSLWCVCFFQLIKALVESGKNERKFVQIPILLFHAVIPQGKLS